MEAGYFEYPNQVFDKLIGRDGPAYVERAKLTPEDAIDLLRKNGAVPVMAHPTYSRVKSDRGEVQSMEETVASLKEHGLEGVEVFYGDYTPEQVARLESLARSLDLIPCGGSDYHCSGNPGEPEPGTVGSPHGDSGTLGSRPRPDCSDRRQDRRPNRPPLIGRLRRIADVPCRNPRR